jgi:hypothetical protein
MPVLAPSPMLVVHNMPSSVTGRMNIVKETLMPVLREVSEILHPVERLRIMKFPETRLIQYDCGACFNPALGFGLEKTLIEINLEISPVIMNILSTENWKLLS